ncbi:MAG TPA: VIT1/CCC1 transporter family protein [Candidatus Paceibacterota bacterium]|nr:VIT1/CCC1 transporter family protein [Candidatus Paceibacterota bacterium]
MNKQTGLYLRSIIFGISDSLVSTVGLLAGIDAAGTPKQTILLTGIVYAFVEAFSMAVGSFLSEQSAEEYEVKGEITGTGPFTAGVVMFISFILASFIPIVPYLIFGLTTALWCSVGFSLLALFIVGMVSAKIVKVNMTSHALKMMLLGGAAIVIGVIVGKFIKAG